VRRWKYHLAAAGALLLIGWGVYKMGGFFGNSEASIPNRPQVNTVDPMDTSSGWRYRQNQPHHWRYIMLKN
jgi:hypothetical protein